MDIQTACLQGQREAIFDFAQTDPTGAADAANIDLDQSKNNSE